jgi:hypothetical protein
MILVFNKTDVKDAEFAKEWMTDFDAFQSALRQEEEAGVFGAEGGTGGFGAGSGYMGSLLNSMSLMLEEFYQHLNVVGVSSMTGEGIDEFFQAVEEKRQEFERDYKPALEQKKKEREEARLARRELELGKLLKDMDISKTQGKTQIEDKPTVSDAELDPTIGESDSDHSGGEENNASATRMEESGLSQRYRQALATSTTDRGEDMSFARYLHESSEHQC